MIWSQRINLRNEGFIFRRMEFVHLLLSCLGVITQAISFEDVIFNKCLLSVRVVARIVRSMGDACPRPDGVRQAHSIDCEKMRIGADRHLSTCVYIGARTIKLTCWAFFRRVRGATDRGAAVLF